MKFIFATIMMVAFVACSSTTKTTTADTTTATATTSQSTPATSAADQTTTSSDTKTKTKTATTTTSSDSTSSTDGALPAISGTEKSSVTCTNKSDTRKISVLSVTEGGCGVVYNKMGADKTVALAKSATYCDSVSSKIKTNLEGAGFNCGGAAATGMSSDQPAQ
ncbi:hypothetical protein K2X05_12885 [bacterium]|nr:hypothetical protein [bacterium]